MRQGTREVLCFLFAITVLAAAADTHAQDDGQSDEVIDEVVVTGSRIARRDFSSPSPIATISRESLLASGQGMLESSLNQMPQVVPHLGRTSNNPGDGTATVNLRGFGANRSLVLLDGRRLAPSGVGTAVDVNNIPQFLIERVEIITGGASAVYGSDAVAGVVNLIRRRDFEGLQIDLSAYRTEMGDSESYDANLAVDVDLAGRGDLTLFGGLHVREPSFAGDREFTAVPWFDRWRTDGSVVQGGSVAVPASYIPGPPADLGNGPVRVTFTSDGDPIAFRNPEDLYNYAPVNYLQTPLDRFVGGLFLDYPLRGTLASYVELLQVRNQSKRNLAPVPVSGLFTINVENPGLTQLAQEVFADNFIPAGPGMVAFGLQRRVEEAGTRVFDDSRDYTRVVAGLRGDIAGGWDFDVWSTYTRGKESTLLLNSVSQSRLQQGLLVDPQSGLCFDPTDGCAPVNPFGIGRLSPEGLAFIRMPPLVNVTSREQVLVSGYVRGEPITTWAGKVDVVAGAEWRRDRGSFRADEALFTGEAQGFAGTASVNGSERVSEVFLEAVVPVLETLGIELGARYSSYSNAGTTDAYKIGGDWAPSESIAFRAMFQRSVRAPNLLEAFQEQFIFDFPYVSFESAEDPCSASADPVGNGNTEKCIATGLPAEQVGVFEASIGFPTEILQGGNPGLLPEKAETVIAGVILTPAFLPGLQVSVDYFDLEILETIGPLVPTVACFDPLNTSNRFCDTFGRDPVTYDVNELVQIQVNRGSQRSRGIDAALDFETALPDSFAIGGEGATAGIGVFWTHTLEHAIAAVSGGTALECKGRFGWPCRDAATGQTFPEDRVTTRFHYRTGDFSAHLSWLWISGADNAVELGAPFAGISDPNVGVPTINSRNYFDLALRYRFGDSLDATFTVANLGNTPPPFMANAVPSNNTDTTLFDIFGRSYTLALSFRYQ